MSATLSTTVQPAGAMRSSTSLRVLTARCEWIARYFIRRAAVAALRELDDRMLTDMGIGRSEIEATVNGLITPSARARA